MQYKEALGLFQKVNCDEALVTPVTVTGDVKPPEWLESTITCKIKVKTGRNQINCYIADKSKSICPLKKN